MTKKTTKKNVTKKSTKKVTKKVNRSKKVSVPTVISDQELFDKYGVESIKIKADDIEDRQPIIRSTKIVHQKIPWWVAVPAFVFWFEFALAIFLVVFGVL